MSESFNWSGKNVLITGGNGFVASNLALRLINLGANVHITVQHYSEHNKIELLSEHDVKYDTEITNMYQYSEIKSILDRHQIDTIFHLAASAIVSIASSSPASTLYNNIIPTINILEAARVNNVPRILVASTDKAYGDHSESIGDERLPYREDYSLRGLDVYSSSKVCTDMICQAIALQYKQHILITRCSNIYGPGDLNFTRLIPRTIMRLLSEKPPVINEGNDHVLREYMYVDEIVNAYIFLAENIDNYYKKEYPRRGDESYGWPCFNVGSYNSKSDTALGENAKDLTNIKDTRAVISLIADILDREYQIDKKEPIIIPKPSNFIEIPNQYLDSKKIIDFGFKSKTELKAGLKKTIKWYKDNFDFLKKLAASYLE